MKELLKQQKISRSMPRLDYQAHDIPVEPAANNGIDGVFRRFLSQKFSPCEHGKQTRVQAVVLKLLFPIPRCVVR